MDVVADGRLAAWDKTSMRSAADLDLALRAVRQACLVTRALQDDLRASDVETKSDDSPVTVGDLAAQAIVALELGQELVGEESASVFETRPELLPRVLEHARRVAPDLDETGVVRALRLGEAEPDPRGYWTLDPIDGTKGFLRGAHYCVSLARVENGVPVLGVLGCPRLGPEPGELEGEGALVWAAGGQSPLVTGLDGDRTARRLEARPAPRSAVRIAESVEASHTDHDLGGRVLRAAGLTPAVPVRIDSQVKYAVVARGDAEVLLRRPRKGYVEKVWDHAAGSLIAAAAGCVVTDLDGAPLDFSRGRRLEANRGVLVARPELHGRILSALARVESA